MDDPPVSLFTNNNALFSFLRYVRFVLWGEKELTIHPKTEALFSSKVVLFLFFDDVPFAL